MAVVVPVLVLGLVEVVLRLAGYGYPVAFFEPAAAGAGCIPNDSFGRRFRCPESPVPFFLPDQKPPGAVRVFVLGESAAAGAPDPAFGVARQLDVLLQDQFPGADLAVHNAALMGIDSHAILPIARECVRHGADVLVVYAGNNELIGTHGLENPATKLPPALSRPYLRAGLWVRTLRLGQWLDSWTGARYAAARQAEVQDAAYFLAHRVAAGDARRSTVAENFYANLRDLCALAAAPGGPCVVLSTVAVNLRDCPPFGSLHRAGLTAAESNRWEAAYRRGSAAQAAAQWPEAVRQFTGPSPWMSSMRSCTSASASATPPAPMARRRTPRLCWPATWTPSPSAPTPG